MKKLFIIFFLFSYSILFSQDTITSLKKILSHTKSKQKKCDIYYKLGYFYSNRNEDSANYYISLTKANNCPLTGLNKAYYYTYLALKSQFETNSKLSEVLPNLRKAEKIFTQYSDSADYFKNLINQGVFLSELDSIFEAITVTQKAIPFCIDHPYTLSKIYLNLGTYYNDIGLIDSAINNYYQAFFIKQKLKDTIGLQIVTGNLADIYMNLNDSVKAIKNIKLTFKYSENDSIGLSYAYQYKAKFYYIFRDNMDSSIFYYKKALKIIKKKQAIYQYLKVYSNLGNTYQKNKNYDEARKIYLAIINLAKENDLNHIYALNLFNLACLDTIQKNYSLSLKRLDTASKYFKIIPDYVKFYLTLYEKSKIYYKVKDYKSAYQFIQKAFNIYKDTILSVEKERAIQQSSIKYQTKQYKLLSKFADERTKLAEIKTSAKEHSIKLLMIIFSLFIVFSILSFFFFKKSMKYKYDKKLLNQQIEAQEKIKKEISSTLHNEIGGKLTSILLNMEAKNKNNILSEEIKRLNNIYSTIRSKSHILSIPTFITTSIADELNDMISSFSTNKLTVNLDIYSKKSWNDVPTSIQQNIYRIVQELFANTIKHSNAKNIDIQLVRNNKQIILIYEDDGKGYNTKEIKYGNGFKNEILRRIKILNAKFNDNSVPNQGVNIIVEINYAKK